MRARADAGAVFELAASQHGVFSRAQAAACGITTSQLRTNLRTGRWEACGPGVLRVAGTPRSWQMRAMAATLSLSGRVVVSHRCAAALHGLDGVAPGHVEVSVSGRSKVRVDAIVHRAIELVEADITSVDQIRVTTIARTLCDLGAVVPPERVEQALDDAMRRRVDLRVVASAVDRLWRPGPSGAPVLARILGEREPGRVPDSWFERLVLKMLKDAGLPRPVVQHEVRDDFGRLIARVDAAYPRLKIAIEADSERFHGTNSGRERDLARTRRLRAAGWEVVPVTWKDLRAPDAVIADLRFAIDRRRLELGA